MDTLFIAGVTIALAIGLVLGYIGGVLVNIANSGPMNTDEMPPRS